MTHAARYLAVRAACAPRVSARPPAATPAPTVSKAPLEQAREAVGKGDFAAAAKILRAEADRGNAEAASALGEFYLSGSGVKASLTDAVTWFKKAADATNSAGMFNLGRILMVGGEGVAKDEDKARFLIRSAAEAGYAPAQFAEGQAAEQVEEKVRDYAEALAWYEKAAAQEHAPALLAIGRFYDVGLSVQRDPAKGTENFMKAARSGSPVATQRCSSD